MSSSKQRRRRRRERERMMVVDEIDRTDFDPLLPHQRAIIEEASTRLLVHGGQRDAAGLGAINHMREWMERLTPVVKVDLDRLWRMGPGERAGVLRKLGAQLRPFVPEVADILETYDGGTNEPAPEPAPATSFTINYSGPTAPSPESTREAVLREMQRARRNNPMAFAGRAGDTIAAFIAAADAARPEPPSAVPMRFLASEDDE